MRKQIALAQEQLELDEARAHVLRNALERHYEDLCRFANGLKPAFYLPTSFGSNPGGLTEYLEQDPLLAALQDHLPRSALWKHINTWDEASQAYGIYVQALKERIWREMTASPVFTEVTSILDMDQLRKAVEDDFGYHMLALLRGEKGLGSTGAHKEVTGIMFRRVELLGLPDDQRAWIAGLLAEAQTWEEFHTLMQAVERLEQTRKAILAELGTIILRRVLPGRCRYCPF